jgi:hypothetical protein
MVEGAAFREEAAPGREEGMEPTGVRAVSPADLPTPLTVIARVVQSSSCGEKEWKL